MDRAEDRAVDRAVELQGKGSKKGSGQVTRKGSGQATRKGSVQSSGAVRHHWTTSVQLKVFPTMAFAPNDPTIAITDCPGTKFPDAS